MEQIIFEEVSDCIVHFEKDKNNTYRYGGTVYPIICWEKNGTGEKGFHYCDNSSSDTREKLDEHCKIMFNFSFSWRGVWEGRIYFPDGEEYWDYELRGIADIWDAIETFLKDRIKNENGDYKYFDK